MEIPSIPREYGGVPVESVEDDINLMYSPRMRGCSRCIIHITTFKTSIPAYAGVNLSLLCLIIILNHVKVMIESMYHINNGEDDFYLHRNRTVVVGINSMRYLLGVDFQCAAQNREKIYKVFKSVIFLFFLGDPLSILFLVERTQLPIQRAEVISLRKIKPDPLCCIILMSKINELCKDIVGNVGGHGRILS